MTSNDKKQTAETPLKHSWGARFKSAREAMNLSEKDAAGRLHLKTHIITIIETENFQDAPPPLFMRGYIRSYGRLLNLSEKELLQALTQMNLAPPPPTTVTAQARRRQPPQQNNPIMSWSTTFVVVMLVGLVGMWWWSTHNRNLNGAVDLANNHPEATQTGTQQSAQPAEAPTPPPAQEATATPVDNLDLKGYVPPNATNSGTINPPPMPAPEQNQAQAQTPNPAAAPNAPAAANSPATAPTPALPMAAATTAPRPTTNTAPAAPGDNNALPQAPDQDAQTTTPDETTAAPATSAATPPASNSVPVTMPTDQSDTNKVKTPATSQTAKSNIPDWTADMDADDVVRPSATRHQQVAKNNSQDFADTEMSVPEQGLDNDTSSDNNN